MVKIIIFNIQMVKARPKVDPKKKKAVTPSPKKEQS